MEKQIALSYITLSRIVCRACSQPQSFRKCHFHFAFKEVVCIVATVLLEIEDGHFAPLCLYLRRETGGRVDGAGCAEDEEEVALFDARIDLVQQWNGLSEPHDCGAKQSTTSTVVL